MSPAWGQGPSGKVRSIPAVVILYIVTLGIYGIVWGWKVTRELDTFARPPKPAHPVYRKGVWFLLAAILPLIVGFVLIIGTIGLSALENDPQAAENAVRDAAGPILLGVLLVLIGAGLGITAAVFNLIALFHFTRNLEGAVKTFVASDSVSGTTLFILFLLGALVSRYGGGILSLVATAMCQVGLNKLWNSPAGMAARPA